MISRAPAISGTTPSPGYRASSTVGEIAKHQGTPIGLKESLFDDEAAAAAERARVRASLRGLTFSQILRSYPHGWERLRQVISNEADLTIGPIQHRIVDGLAETTSILRHLRTSGVTAYRG